MKLGKREQIAQAIVEYIKSKDASYGFQLPTVKAMAEMFSVSVETVRQAIEILKKDGVIQGQRGCGLFYRPEITSTNRVVALVLLNTDAYVHVKPYPSLIMKRLKKQFDSYNLELLPCPLLENESPITYAQRLQEMDVAGILLFEVFYAPLITALQGLRRPMASMDTDLTSFGVPSVVVDNRMGTALATNVCIEKGHREIAFMGLPSMRTFNQAKYYDPVSEERYDGYRLQMQLHGLRESRLALSYEQRSSSEKLAALINNAQRPTAVIFDSDGLARDTAKACIAAGMSIPEDVSFCGFGYKNTKYDEHKKLSSVFVNWPQMGKLGADIINQQLLGEQVLKMKHVLPVQWIDNDSCSDELQ